MPSGPAERPRLRIGLLTHSVNPRGGVVHTIELANALHDRGHRVTVLAPAAPGQRLFRMPRCAVELVAVMPGSADGDGDGDRGGVAAMVAARRAACVGHLSVLLQRQTFDVLHAQDAIGANALADLCDAGAISGFVRTVHHLDHFGDTRLMAWQERACRRASTVLCVSASWRDTLQQQMGLAAALVPNGVDLARFSQPPQAGDASIASRHGLRPGAPLLLAIGGVEERKNTCGILQAFIALQAGTPSAQLAIAGGASLLDHSAYGRQFQQLLGASGLPSDPGAAVHVLGTVPDADMPALLRSACVVLLPSLREGFGLVVLEALASGTPVVVSRSAPFTEHLSADEQQDHCLWADPHSSNSIAQAMRRALAPAHKQALALRMPDVCRRFSWQASAVAHEPLYRAHIAAIAARGGPAAALDPAPPATGLAHA